MKGSHSMALAGMVLVTIALASSLVTAAPLSFVFSPYKDIGINMNWNTYTISSTAAGGGAAKPLTEIMPSGADIVTLAFATGDCASESWAGVTPAQLAPNLPKLVAAGKKYIISTGGAAGTFTCSSDAEFKNFIERYKTDGLVGIDFDIEGSLGADAIASLVARVKNAQSTYPNLRFSWTLATLAPGAGGQSLGNAGVMVMQAIKDSGIKDQYINLMAMDYGSAAASNCILKDGKCDMGASAVQAAKNLNSFYGVPFDHIEVTPMIGENDSQDQIFTLPDVNTLMDFVNSQKLGGVHLWSFDRDVACATTSTSWTSPDASCSHYTSAGPLGYTKQFHSQAPPSSSSNILSPSSFLVASIYVLVAVFSVFYVF